MITAIIKGGLGNQLFQYAAALSLAKYHKTEISLNTNFFKNEDDRSFKLDKLIEIPSDVEIDEFPSRSNLSLYEKVFQRFKPWYRRNYIKDTKTNTIDFYYRFPENCVLEGYWQNEEFIKFAVPFLKKQLIKSLKPSNKVAVHFRGGDYLKPNISAYHGNMNEQYYKQAFALLTENQTDLEFFLFSDSPEHFKFDFLEQYSHSWVVEKDEIIAFNELCTFQNFIIANSSFSWWPAFLNNEAGGSIIAPKEWFKVEHLKNYSPALDSWIKL